jgi:hypothetical protein
MACAALAVTASAASAIHYESESLSTLQAQLHAHEVSAVGFHPSSGTAHIHASLNDGRHVTIAYLPSEQEQLVAQVRAAGATVTIAKAKQKAAKKATHHKLRYIAGGILIVVIIVVAGVLLVDRRRRLNETGGGASAAPTSGDAA